MDDVPGQNKPKLAENFMATVAEKLKLSRCVMPAFEADKSKPMGWVLPLGYEKGKWTSVKWPFSEKKPIQLFAGDSPVGLRLPLGDLKEDTRGLCIRSTNWKSPARAFKA